MSTTRSGSEKKAADSVSPEQAKKDEEKKQKEAEEKARREKEHQSYNDFLKYALPDLKNGEDDKVYKREGDNEERKPSIEVDEKPTLTTLAQEGTYTAEGKVTLIVGADGSVRFDATNGQFNKNPAKHFGDALHFLKYNGGKEVATLSYPHLSDEHSRNRYVDPRHLMMFMDEAEKRGMKVQFGKEVTDRLAQARQDDQDLFHPGRYKTGIGAENYEKIMRRMHEVNAKFDAKQPATKALIDIGRLTDEMNAELKLPADDAKKKATIEALFKNADGSDMSPQEAIDKAFDEMKKVEQRLQQVEKAMTLLTDQEANAARDPKLENAIYEKGKLLQAAFDAERKDVEVRKGLLEDRITNIIEPAPVASAAPKDGEPAKPAPMKLADVQKKVDGSNGLMDKMNQAQARMEKNVSDFAEKMGNADQSNNRTPQP